MLVLGSFFVARTGSERTAAQTQMSDVGVAVK
jgi:hypothetical protein